MIGVCSLFNAVSLGQMAWPRGARGFFCTGRAGKWSEFGQYSAGNGGGFVHGLWDRVDLIGELF